MPMFQIQFQPARSSREAEAAVIAAFRIAVPEATIESGEDDGRHINISFDARSVAAGWSAILPVFRSQQIGPAARDSCIVVCEGDHGWDDYLLLHHYDSNEVLDRVPEVRPAR